jgi:hypothetical protein
MQNLKYQKRVFVWYLVRRNPAFDRNREAPPLPEHGSGPPFVCLILDELHYRHHAPPARSEKRRQTSRRKDDEDEGEGVFLPEK